jgi:hypothetical protein
LLVTCECVVIGGDAMVMVVLLCVGGCGCCPKGLSQECPPLRGGIVIVAGGETGDVRRKGKECGVNEKWQRAGTLLGATSR